MEFALYEVPAPGEGPPHPLLTALADVDDVREPHRVAQRFEPRGDEFRVPVDAIYQLIRFLS